MLRGMKQVFIDFQSNDIPWNDEWSQGRFHIAGNCAGLFFASKKVNLPMLTVHKIVLVGLLRC